MQQGQRRGTFSLTRLETFADGVFAIAITLLVLEIRLPAAPAGGHLPLSASLTQIWPSYVGYVLSFIVIGIMWINHHNLFTLVDHADHSFVVLNLLLLMGAAFVPFPTRVLAENLTNTDAKVAATAFYCGTFTGIAVLYNVLWRYASGGRRLLRSTVADHLVATITRRYFFGPTMYFLSTLLAFISVAASLAVIAGLAILFLWPYRRETAG